MTPRSSADESGSTQTFPSWTFRMPVAIANKGVQIAIFGQDPATLTWKYWDNGSGSYVDFNSGTNGQDTAPLINATPQKGSYTGADDIELAVNLSADQFIQSGAVAMFIGGSSGIPVTGGVPASPTTSTNPNDLYSLFEFSYLTGSPSATLDIDISNVDQVGFTYVVESSSAPFPLEKVGSTVEQQILFGRFNTLFPSTNPFSECLLYGQEVIDGTRETLRLLAPQDVLQEIAAPLAPSFLQPTGAPGTSDPFADKTYFYKVTETSGTGETTPNLSGVFGGFLLNSSGNPQASGINVGWQSGGNPVAYTPTNPSATGLNIYRASGPAASAGSTPPTPPDHGYGMLKGMSIQEWNRQTNFVFLDQETSVGLQGPPTSSYGFSALATWFDRPLGEFFNRFVSKIFALYQFNQNNGEHGTLWTGTVLDVTPNSGQPITTRTYIDESGNSQSIDTTWTWGDGTQTYKVLQLVGNAYDPNNYSNTQISGASGLTQGEYQGAVVNIYFPYFRDNTGLASVNLPGLGSYTLPDAPSWLNNGSNGPSQMVFGCAGVFATPNDPDATAQQGTYPVLAKDALTNLQNVIVSALNRGIATGYDFAVNPQGYSCLYGMSQAPAAGSGGTLPAGTYTYYLSGTLNDGSETALTWSQTVELKQAGSVTLNWLPQSSALYTQANIYRQQGTGPMQLVGTVANTASSQATTFVDNGGSLPTQPTTGAPFAFYPSWNDSTAAGFVNSNLFSAFLHQNLTADPDNGVSINGLVYGYPFDDQGNFSTNINYGSSIPASITFTFTDLG